MRLPYLAIVSLLLCCSRSPSDAPDNERERASIDHLSALIGDESFVSAYQRPPTADDDVEDRIRTHLLYVEKILRSKDLSGWSEEQKSAREHTLDQLHIYAQAGEFPEGESQSGYLPTFIDDHERRCAVAYLVEESEGSEVIRRINESYRNAFVRDIQSPALLAWVDTSGLSVDEVALIQPAYPPRPDDVRHQVLLRSELQLGSSENSVEHLSGVEAHRQWNSLTGRTRTMFALQGFAGLANVEDFAYRLHAWIGWDGGFEIPKEVIDGVRRTPWSAGPHAFGVHMGAGVDQAGGNVGLALTLPTELYYSFPSSEQTRLSLHAGPVVTIVGNDRPHGFQSALRLRWKRAFSWLGLDSWDLYMGLDYQRKASANFAGLQIGLGKYPHDGWHITE